MTDLLQLILDHATDQSDKVALRDAQDHFTYPQLAERVETVASGLSALGVEPGQRVGLYLENSAAFVTVALGCLWLGAAFVPLSPESPPARVTTIVQDCQPVLVVCGGEAALLVPLVRVVGVDEVLAAGRAGAGPERAWSPQRDAFVIYTSGTTGKPKGVVVQEQAMNCAVQQQVEAMALGPGLRAMSVASFHFDGSYGVLFCSLVAGGSLLVTRREEIFFPKRFCQLVVDEQITFTSCSPSYLRLVVSSRHLPLLAGCQLSVWAMGGEEMVASVVAKLWSVLPGVKVYNRYGPTETTIAVTTYPVTAQDVAAGLVPIGYPHAGTEFALVDEDGTLIEGEAQPGELYIGGQQLMRAYWGDEDLSRAVLRQDVVPGTTMYKTGDLVHRDGQGRYVYDGRLDDVVKRNGVRISLGEVARSVLAAPGVTGSFCALVARDGAPGIAAFVVAGASVTVDEMRAAAAAQLPESMLPDEFVVVPTLPMTSQGKVDRRRLLADAGFTGWH